MMCKKCCLLVFSHVLLSFPFGAVADDAGSDWEVIEREKPSENIETNGKETGDEDKETKQEPFSEPAVEEEIVETVTEEMEEDLAQVEVGNEEETEEKPDCLRCRKKIDVDFQILGFRTPVGVTGVTVTKHIKSRTSVQGGLGYGFGGYNFTGGVLHYFQEDRNLHFLTGLTVTIGGGEDEEFFEGLWFNLGIGSSFRTQAGVAYGIDLGVTMALLENVFTTDMKLCFGVLAQDSCREKWRILPYITPVKFGYSF